MVEAYYRMQATSKQTYKGTNKRQKYEYQCNSCKEWFPEKKINVDHINPAGSLIVHKTYQDL